MLNNTAVTKRRKNKGKTSWTTKWKGTAHDTLVLHGQKDDYFVRAYQHVFEKWFLSDSSRKHLLGCLKVKVFESTITLHDWISILRQFSYLPKQRQSACQTDQVQYIKIAIFTVIEPLLPSFPFPSNQYFSSSFLRSTSSTLLFSSHLCLSPLVVDCVTHDACFKRIYHGQQSSCQLKNQCFRYHHGGEELPVQKSNRKYPMNNRTRSQHSNQS